MIKKSLILLAALPLAGCFNALGGEDPGPMGEMSEAITAFEELSVGGGYAVVVQTGEEPSLTMEGPENMLAETQIVQEGDRLTIKTKSGSWNWRGNDGVRILIGTPTIRAASAEGGADIAIDTVEGETFAGSASGGGDLKVGALDVASASFDVSGGGDIEVAGTVNMRTSQVMDVGQAEAIARVMAEVGPTPDGYGTYPVRHSDESVRAALSG